MPYKDVIEGRRKSLEYYYKNKEKVLFYQKKYLAEKYNTDGNFRKKRQLRDKSRLGKKPIEGCCEYCNSSSDLQRHHPNYDDVFCVV